MDRDFVDMALGGASIGVISVVALFGILRVFTKSTADHAQQFITQLINVTTKLQENSSRANDGFIAFLQTDLAAKTKVLEAQANILEKLLEHSNHHNEKLIMFEKLVVKSIDDGNENNKNIAAIIADLEKIKQSLSQA